MYSEDVTLYSLTRGVVVPSGYNGCARAHPVGVAPEPLSESEIRSEGSACVFSLNWVFASAVLHSRLLTGLPSRLLFSGRPSTRSFRSKREGRVMPHFPSETKCDARGANDG